MEFLDGVVTIHGEAVGMLGSWSVEDLDAARTEDGVLLLVDGEPLIATIHDQALEKVLVTTLIKRPWWFYALPALAGLALALTIWAMAA